MSMSCHFHRHGARGANLLIATFVSCCVLHCFVHTITGAFAVGLNSQRRPLMRRISTDTVTRRFGPEIPVIPSAPEDMVNTPFDPVIRQAIEDTGVKVVAATKDMDVGLFNPIVQWLRHLDTESLQKVEYGHAAFATLLTLCWIKANYDKKQMDDEKAKLKTKRGLKKIFSADDDHAWMKDVDEYEAEHDPEHRSFKDRLKAKKTKDEDADSKLNKGKVRGVRRKPSALEEAMAL